MISDFLEHLEWEVRTNAFESQQAVGEGKINPELVEQLGKYVKKYGTPLQPIVLVGKRDPNEFKAEQLSRQLADLAHLEALRHLFDMALATALHTYEKGELLGIRPV